MFLFDSGGQGSAAEQPHHKQQHDRANDSDHEAGKIEASDALRAEEAHDPTPKERADDANHNIGNGAHLLVLAHDDACNPACQGAEDDPYDEIHFYLRVTRGLVINLLGQITSASISFNPVVCQRLRLDFGSLGREGDSGGGGSSLHNDHIFLFRSLPADHGPETPHKDCESVSPCFLWHTADLCAIDMIHEYKFKPRRERSA